MENSAQKAKEIVYKLWRTPQYNNEITSMFTTKQLATILVDEILLNIETCILYHKDSLSLPINKQYWMDVKSAIKNVE